MADAALFPWQSLTARLPDDTRVWPAESASHCCADNVLLEGLEVVLILIVITLIAANILERVWLRLRHSNQAARTSMVAASIIGIIAGVIGAQHGYYEILQRDRPLNGILFDAVSGTSFSNLPTSQWTGWPAVTLVQNFRITGIFAILVSLVVIVWSAMFMRRKNGGRTLGLLSILMFLVGGGFIPPLLGIIAAAIGSHRKSKQGVLS
jgi:uncharacterized membrane protein HdeD (DUF308 family)